MTRMIILKNRAPAAGECQLFTQRKTIGTSGSRVRVVNCILNLGTHIQPSLDRFFTV